MRRMHYFLSAMNFLQRINQVASQDGVEAVFAFRSGNEPSFAGEDQYRELAEQAARVHASSPIPMIRINAGTHAIFVSGDGETTVTLIFKSVFARRNWASLTCTGWVRFIGPTTLGTFTRLPGVRLSTSPGFAWSTPSKAVANRFE